MAGFVKLLSPDKDGNVDINDVFRFGSGWYIGDGLILTAGHVIYRFNEKDDIDDRALVTLTPSETNEDDYSRYEIYGPYQMHNYYAAFQSAWGEYPDDLPSPTPPYQSIGDQLAGVNSVRQQDQQLVQGSGTVGSGDAGVALFISASDAFAPELGLTNDDDAITLRRRGASSNSQDGTITADLLGYRYHAENSSQDARQGDSGGPVLMDYLNHTFIIGSVVSVVSSNVNNPSGDASVLRFDKDAFYGLMDHLEAAQQPGNVSSREPTNLIVGGASSGNINGTFRPDIILGRGGDDIIDDGDGPSDTIYANDTLIGGDGADTLKAGAGNDEIWGGDKDAASNETGVVDTADYSPLTNRITVAVTAAGMAADIIVSDGLGGTDTLHFIDKIIATAARDVFSFNGLFDADYALTIDANGGQSDDNILDFTGMGGGFALQNTDNGGTLTSTGGGVITLLNFNTQIIGSAYDDEITDLAEHDGLKRIDGGGGNDVITVGGSDALIRGGDGDDELNGGDGNDILLGGEGIDIVHGGGGSDYLANHRPDDFSPEYDYSDEDELNGGDGHDYLFAAASGAILNGGAGNDVIESRSTVEHFVVEIGPGDGHDVVLGEGWQGPDPTLDEALPFLAYNFSIQFLGLARGDVTIHWDVSITDQEDTEFYQGAVIRRSYAGVGDLAIVVNSTGASILIRNVAGHFHTHGNHDPFVDATHFDDFTLPELEFTDGWFGIDDGGPNVEVVRGSVSQYATALADYLAATAANPADTEGTAGDDDLAGSRGDDEIDGGDGDDSFQSSGGADAIDGGAGSDSLFLFGAFTDFLVTRDAATGDLTLTDKTGLEGAITIKSVEKIYFAADNEEHDPYDLITFLGTPDHDLLVEGDSNDNLIYGLEGDDLLRGLDGNDLLDGGTGADTMEGGLGDDIYYVEAAGDLVTEAIGGGSDRIATSVSYALASGSEVELLEAITLTATNAMDLAGNELNNLIIGNNGANILRTNGGNDTIYGAGGNDYFVGGNAANGFFGGLGDDTYYLYDSSDAVLEDVGAGNDRVATKLSVTLTAGSEIETLEALNLSDTDAVNLGGNEFANLVIGNAGANQLDGGGGADVLVGLGGADSFAFTTALGGGNVDRIDGFAAADDTIVLEDAVFGGLAPGGLAANAFVTGGAATTADHRIVYNQTTGELYYDADGNGGGAAVLFATLQGAPVLTASDFIVV